MYIAQCNLRSKNIRRELIYVVKTKHEISQRAYRPLGIFLSERYRFERMLKTSLLQFSTKLVLHLCCYGGKNYMSR